MSENNTISIIIPVYNKWELTKACLTSLQAHTPPGTYEVIVVDNASSDATASELDAYGNTLFPGAFRRIRNHENNNFAGACNQGARAAVYDLLFFLNNDTILTPNWLVPLTDALANDITLAAVGPLLLYPDNTVQHLGAAVFPDRSIHHFYSHIPADHPLALKKRRLNFITAAAVLLRKNTFFATGAFHEGYVNGLEDVELCYRLRSSGHELAVIPESVVYHLESQTRGDDIPPVNSPLLRQRCPDLRGKPEFHLIAAADGYTPYFDPFFTTFLAPAPERLKRYASPTVSSNIPVLTSILEREIYWEDGYAALAALHEQKGDTPNALCVLERGIKFHPSLRLIKQALPFAPVYASYLKEAAAALSNKEFFATRYAGIFEMARLRDDTALSRMLARWRAEYAHLLP